MQIPSDDIEAELDRSDLHRDYFLGWQCRIREHISRKENGRPSKGISPTVQLREDDDSGSDIITLLFLNSRGKGYLKQDEDLPLQILSLIHI